MLNGEFHQVICTKMQSTCILKTEAMHSYQISKKTWNRLISLVAMHQVNRHVAQCGTHYENNAHAWRRMDLKWKSLITGGSQDRISTCRVCMHTLESQCNRHFMFSWLQEDSVLPCPTEVNTRHCIRRANPFLRLQRMRISYDGRGLMTSDRAVNWHSSPPPFPTRILLPPLKTSNWNKRGSGVCFLGCRRRLKRHSFMNDTLSHFPAINYRAQQQHMSFAPQFAYVECNRLEEAAADSTSSHFSSFLPSGFGRPQCNQNYIQATFSTYLSICICSFEDMTDFQASDLTKFSWTSKGEEDYTVI